MTVRATNGYVYPASHRAGLDRRRAAHGRAAAPQGGKRHLGLHRRSVQKIFRAMKTYGLIVADNGSDMYITGTFDTRWNNDILNPAFGALTASDFEVVQLGWQPGAHSVALSALGVNPASVTGGQGSNGHRDAERPGARGRRSRGPFKREARGGQNAGERDHRGRARRGVVCGHDVGGGCVDRGRPPGVVRRQHEGGHPHGDAAVTDRDVAPAEPVHGGGRPTSTGTVALSRAAPPGGVVVALGSSKPAVAGAPATVAVAAGQVSASFAISTTAVPAGTSAVILGVVQRRGAQDRDVDRHTSRDVLAQPGAPRRSWAGRAQRHGDALWTRSVGRDRPDAHQLAPIPGRRAAQRDGRGGTTVRDLQPVTTMPVTADTTAWISGAYRGATKGATLAIKR